MLDFPASVSKVLWLQAYVQKCFFPLVSHQLNHRISLYTARVSRYWKVICVLWRKIQIYLEKVVSWERREISLLSYLNVVHHIFWMSASITRVCRRKLMSMFLSCYSLIKRFVWHWYMCIAFFSAYNMERAKKGSVLSNILVWQIFEKQIAENKSPEAANQTFYINQSLKYFGMFPSEKIKLRKDTVTELQKGQ